MRSKSFRLSLVALDYIRFKDPKISLGHGSILARLYQENKVQNGDVIVDSYEYNIKDSFKLQTKQNFLEFCSQVAHYAVEKNPNLIAFGAFIWNEAHIQRIIKILRDDLKFRGLICLGGPQVSYALPNTLETYYSNVDLFIRGYAEDTFARLILVLSESNEKAKSMDEVISIKGVHKAGNPLDLGSQAIADLENLPSPFLTNIIDLNRSFIRWETSRGCPFMCAFCQHRDSYMSRQKVCMKRIESEIQAFCSPNSKVNDIAVLDPTFNSGSNYLDVLDALIRHGYSGKLALQTRIEMIKDEFIKKLNLLQANGSQIILECGIQTINKEELKIIRRQNNMNRITEIAQKLKNNSIPFEASIIYGLPKQTLESFQKTVSFCQTLKPARIDAWPLMLLRGTEMEYKKLELGLTEEIVIANENIGMDLPEERIYEGIPHVTSSTTFTKSEWSKMATIAKSLNK